MARLHVNNYTTTVATDLTDSGTTLVVTTATGLPTLSAGQYYYLTLDNLLGVVEIVKVTARTGTSLTIVRAQESTTGVAWATGSLIECRATAESFTPGSVLSNQALTTATVATGDLVLIQDVSDSKNLKTVTTQSIADLAAGGNAFGTIAVSGQSDVVADSATDTLTLVAGTNITLTTNAGTDTVTINGTGGATLGDGDYGDVTVSSSGTVITIDTPSSATIANDDKVLIKDTSASDVMKYITTQAVRDLVPGSGTLTSAQLATSLTDETGSGANVFATSPTLVTPLLGTPTSGTLTNCTGLPEGGLSLTDITTNNSSTSNHGFLKKLNNDATYYMDGTGAWSVPAGGGGGITALTGDVTASGSGSVAATFAANPVFTGTAEMVLPKGTTAQRVGGFTTGRIRYNSTLDAFEGFGATGSWTGMQFVQDFNISNGIFTKTTDNTYVARTMTGTAAKITVTNGDGISGNPTFTISSSYLGQTSITDLGTITTGTWNATVVGLAYGGTGVALTASNGGIVYSNGTTLAILSGTATASKMLLSGSSTTPTWSTSTIPTSAGATANKLLLSDGTNYVLSTPTFPNASATTRKMTVSDGTNWVASTETWAVPGSSGNVLRSDGTNWVAAKAVLTTDVTGTLPIANGGTAVTSVTTAPTASSFAGWDANSNLSANNLLEGYTTTATAAGTTTLVVGSTYQQMFTGSTTQTCKLPVVSTLALGTVYSITNLSTGVVTIQSSGANTIQAMAANTTIVVQSNATTGTGASVWNVLAYTSAASDITGSGSLVRATGPTFSAPVLGTPASGALTNCTSIPVANATGTLAVANGGTGVTKIVLFSAATSGSQSITANTYTKVTLSSEEFDNNNNFDPTTNYRFTPTVAGKYLFTAYSNFASASDQGYVITALYKNGSNYTFANSHASGTSDQGNFVSSLIDMNGSTDYVELYVFIGVSTNNLASARLTGNWVGP